MCDTVGKVINEHYAIFGKNSDRAVNEPQVVEFYEAKDYLDNEKLKCTYIEIDQAKHTNAIVLSRPTWLWGGEIGVNEYGVCIGNEAVFTKGKYGKDSLIGMDLLRLGLERGNSAKEALDVIIDLLQKYDQGGNCGYDSNFHYDNSFLILDRKEIFVLETVGKDYTYKKYNHASISNALTIEDNGDFYKEGKCDFKKKYTNSLMTFGSAGRIRQCSSINGKLDSLKDMIKILTSHNGDINPFKNGSVSSVCMHASNSLTADGTTSSMIVELKDEDIIIWLTGSSNPCVSLYKPAMFKVNGLIFKNEKGNDNYFREREQFNRRFLCKKVPSEYMLEKEEIQDSIIDLVNVKLDEDAVNAALELDNAFYEKWKEEKFSKDEGSFIYKNFWQKKINNFNMRF